MEASSCRGRELKGRKGRRTCGFDRKKRETRIRGETEESKDDAEGNRVGGTADSNDEWQQDGNRKKAASCWRTDDYLTINLIETDCLCLAFTYRLHCQLIFHQTSCNSQRDSLQSRAEPESWWNNFGRRDLKGQELWLNVTLCLSLALTGLWVASLQAPDLKLEG